MNYYKRHIGDYSKDAGWLTTYQHGVYALLLDKYYGGERAIPVDLIYRIVRAVTGPERKAVDEVISAFFDMTKEQGFAHNKRADIEITKRKAKGEVNSLIAKEAWDAKRIRNASETHSESNASHKPLASNHKEQQKEHVPPSASRFAEFWESYPIKRGKKPAEAKWKQKKLDADADRLIADVKRRVRDDEQWRNGFVPHAATYLHQERWTDELAGRKQAAPQQTEYFRADPKAIAAREARAGGNAALFGEIVQKLKVGEAV